MAGPITPYGKKWEMARSIWMVWVFFPFALTAFISFLYIGIKMKKKKWIIAGAIYFVIMAQYFFFFSDYPIDHLYFDISMGIILTGWIISCMHVVLARREYLQLLAQQMGKNPYVTQPQHKPNVHIKKSVSLDDIPKKKKTNKKSKKRKAKRLQPQVIYINKASKEQIAALPSIGNVLASEIVRVREQQGPFKSFAHFVEVMNMKPHVIAKAKPYLRFTEDDVNQTRKKNKDDDKNDKNNPNNRSGHQMGRVVDY